MKRLFIDFETYSDLDLRKVGVSRYARHESTEVLMGSWAVDRGPVYQWVPAEGDETPDELLELLFDPAYLKSAWNAAFELNIFEHVLGIETPLEQWQCTMVMAFGMSLPGKLEKAGEVVGLPQDKQKDSRGRALITLFSKPRKPTKNKPYTRADHTTDPERWEEFKDYNRTDVEAERAIFYRIRKWNLPEHEWDLWRIDQRINAAGLPINRAMARNANGLYEEIVADRRKKIKGITGVDNPNSQPQLLEWLEGHGYPFADLKKGHVEQAPDIICARLEEDGADPWAAEEAKPLLRTLELRLEAARVSAKKYAALDRATDGDGLLRYTLQFGGAQRTLRWGGRIFQPQNLPRPDKEFEDRIEACAYHVERLSFDEIELIYDKPMDLLASTIRPCAQATPGKVFCDADLNAIENRVLGYVAGCEKILDVFRKGRDPYLDFATYMYHQSYDELLAEKNAGDKSKRTMAKPAVLGCGYRLSAGRYVEDEKTGEIIALGLLGYAKDMGVEMTVDQAEHAVTTFRQTYKEVVQFWYDIEREVKTVLKRGGVRKFRMLRIDRSGPFLRIHLPSGRALHYVEPKLQQRKTPWGEYRETITYMGENNQKQWVRLQTHGGKLTENIVQAMARDVLAHGVKLSYAKGLDIRLHVHDQIVILSRKSKADRNLETLKSCMEADIPWAPALPLKADGFISRVFMKD